MKLFRLFGFVCLALLARKGFAQEGVQNQDKSKNDTIRVSVTMVDNELIPWVRLQDVVIFGKRVFKNDLDRAKYNRLRYNVLKVWPYAVMAREKYAQLQRDLALTADKKEQRRLVKAANEEVKQIFNKEIKNLTMTQGGILIKLIDREIGISSFQIIKEMKGGLTAFLYQSVAKIFENNLKTRYDPEEDRDIEAIVQSITNK